MAEGKSAGKDVHGGAAKKSASGPHGGGTAYNQLAMGKGFIVHEAKPGSAHTTTKNQDGGGKKK